MPCPLRGKRTVANLPYPTLPYYSLQAPSSRARCEGDTDTEHRGKLHQEAGWRLRWLAMLAYLCQSALLSLFFSASVKNEAELALLCASSLASPSSTNTTQHTQYSTAAVANADANANIDQSFLFGSEAASAVCN